MDRPRLPWLACAFGAGIWLCDASGPLSRAPLAWLSIAVLAAAFATHFRRRFAVFAAVAALGATASAAHRASDPVAGAPVIGVDDRDPEVVVGRVVGPVEDRHRTRDFRVEATPSGAVVEVSARGRPAVLPGDVVRVRGRLRRPRGYRTPGAFDHARRSERRGVWLRMSVSARDVTVVQSTWSLWRGPGRVQRAASTAIAGRGGDARARGVARAMLTGDRSGIAPATADSFRDAGLAHVLAVSGLHLAATALLVFAAVRRVWTWVPALAVRADATRVAATCALPAAVAFATMAGGRPSTLRALVVVACVLVGAMLRRRPRLVDSLGVAALALLALSPATLYDPSFQLSFAATAALAIAPVRGSRIKVAVLSTAWVTLALAPLTAATFGAVPVGGLAANVVAIPIAELAVLPLGLLGLLVSTVWEAGGGALLDLSIAASRALVAVADIVATAVPPIRTPSLSTVEALAGAVAVAAAGVAWARPDLRRRAIAVAVVAVFAFGALFARATWWQPARRDYAVVAFIDVGQGDAAVIEVPGGEVWLVDAGGLPFVAADEPDPRRAAALPGERAVARYLAHRRIDHIDVAVLSHPHPDHVAGLRAVAEEVSIGEVWVARGADYGDWLDDIGAEVVHPRLGDARRAGGAALEVLAPRYEADVAAVDPVFSVNDNSLVVRVRFGGRRVLFAGDLEAEGEALLASAAADLRADVVKVPHHGSRTSSTPAFVRATSPAVAVVSCGVANRFGFPAPEVVARWRAAGARVLRTDQRGAVTVRIWPNGRLQTLAFDESSR